MTSGLTIDPDADVHDEAVSAAPPGRLARWRRRLPDTITCAVIVAMVAFVLGGIGIQLAGIRILADTSSLTASSIYRDGGMPQSSSGTLGVNDTIDAATPNEALFGQHLRDGELAEWNPYALGGAPLAATPNFGLFSPMALPFWVLPAWLAPAYVKLLELIVAVGGTYLFLRRLRLRPAAACLGGMVFASSAFLVGWTGWPQTRTAAMIPALFWALDRLADRFRWRNLALVALAVACMLLSGFPSVTGYALLTGAIFLAVRLLAQRPLVWRTVVGRAVAAGGAVLAGAAVTAWQLVPWATYMTTALVRGRDQVPGQHIQLEALLTTIAPYALGSASARDAPTWFGSSSFVEGVSYVGAAALVLMVTAIALAGRGRALLPRGVWWFLVAGLLSWGTVIYAGGLPLTLLQRTGYLFSDNFVGRARSVLGLLVAALAAVGFELVLRRREEPAVPATRGSRAYGTGVWLAVALGGGVLYSLGHRLAAARGTTIANTTGSPNPTQITSDVASLNERLGVGLAIVALTGAAIAWIWFGRGRPRLVTVGLILIPLLIAGQGLAFVLTYYPHSRQDTFYPTNAVHDYLAQTLGHERFFGSSGAIYGSVETIHGLREFQGHGFMEQGYGDLVGALPGKQFLGPPSPATVIRGDPAGGATARSPILDRASVTEYITPPELQPFGVLHPATGDGTTTTLSLGHPITVTVPVTGPVRGIGITPGAGAAQTLREQIELTVRDGSGKVVAQAARVDRAIAANTPFIVALAADQVPAGTKLTVTIELKPFSLIRALPAPLPVPMTLLARAGQPTLTVVTPTPNDGLRLVFDGQSVIYQRTTALPRARWASSTVVEPDPAARVRLLASGTLAADTVVLNAPGVAASGQPATVDWVEDALDSDTLRVNAQGAGYLVLADAIQHGWSATVDGAAVPLVPADHAFVAVPVPAGQHEIRFAYHPVSRLALTVSLAAAVGLIVLVVVEAILERRRRP